jgi:DNA-binding CsgD family transcriptional regulator
MTWIACTADVTVASSLQPVLAILDRSYPVNAPPRTEGSYRHDARQRVGLTDRELDMIVLLAQGLTAQQIARIRRISVRTVRKYLEHTYGKLDCHDRLLAVEKARELGSYERRRHRRLGPRVPHPGPSFWNEFLRAGGGLKFLDEPTLGTAGSIPERHLSTDEDGGRGGRWLVLAHRARVPRVRQHLRGHPRALTRGS